MSTNKAPANSSVNHSESASHSSHMAEHSTKDLEAQVVKNATVFAKLVKTNNDSKKLKNFILGDDFNDENEDLLLIPHGSYEVNIQQFIYESVILNLPSRRIHPGIEDGTLQSDILDKLEELSPKERKEDTEEPQQGPTDPRWDSLKKLLNDK